METKGTVDSFNRIIFINISNSNIGIEQNIHHELNHLLYFNPDNSWVELAEETSANVIVSNRVGKERDMKYKGGSCIIDRNKKVYTYGSNFDEVAVVGGLILV